MSPIRSFITIATLLIASLPMVNAGVITQGSREPYRPLMQREGSEPPLNMIVLGRDHRLWYEAYNDASDLDGDKILDVGYKGYLPGPSYLTGWNIATAKPGQFKIDYYGYFDSYKCYSYNTTSKRFIPIEKTDNKMCPNDSTAPWSGDYLNYLTTSRMDAIRKVLYGGYRQVDSTTETVLRRAWIPQDAHAFGKQYTSTAYDVYAIEDYTPFSQPAANRRHVFANTTLCGGDCSTAYTQPPVLRYKLDADFYVWEWLSIERPVADSQYARGNNARTTITGIVDRQLDVQVCKSGLLENNCKQYGTSFKPTGLLQQYGDNDTMRFGLLTGSYKNNTEYGVLRKNIGKIQDEIEASTGKFTGSTGIIDTLNKLRIQGIASSREYFNLGDGDDKCSYSEAFSRQLPNGSCSAWGNPVGEMLFEAVKYFSGGNASYTTDSKGNGLGLSVPTWTDPYGIPTNGTTRRNSICAKPYITLISDINPNFDSGSATATINSISYNRDNILTGIWNNEFGSGTSKNILIGNNGTTNDNAPTVKAATTFVNLSGMPDEAAKQGTYSSAAIAYFARTNDINPAPDKQQINTFSVALSSPLPKISIPVGDKFVIFIPFAKSPSNGGGSTGNSTNYRPTDQIVDYYIESIYNISGYATSSSVNSGRPQITVLVNFEDVEYGGDHDMDAIAKYTIKVNSDNTFTIITDSNYAGGGINQHMGYILDGTTKDGVYLVVKDMGGYDVQYWMDAKPASAGNPSGNPINPQGNLSALTDTRTFTPSTVGSTVFDLKSPMWFAAKYGGFIDADTVSTQSGYNKPDKAAEWEDPSNPGTPANFYLVTNPLKLQEQLGKAFARIDSTARATAAVSGGGGNSNFTNQRVYRSYYKMDQWSGGVGAFDISEDLTTVTPAWDTKDYLVSPANRKIFTHNGSIPLSFGTSIVNTANTPNILNPIQLTEMGRNLSAPYTAADRLQYLRGVNSLEGSVFRSRAQIDTATNYYGDILESQPYAAGAPTRGNNSTEIGYEGYRIETDGNGKNYYDHAVNNTYRRSKIFVGANDGMLHVIDDSQTRDPVTNMDTGTMAPSTETAPYDPVGTSRPGKELMAYVPSFVYTRNNMTTGAVEPKISEYSKLTGYGHEFFVNGQVAIADMIYGTNWSTVLAGTVAFGGKGVYALNVTSDVFGAAASDHVLFEYTADMDKVNGAADPSAPLDANKKMSDIGYITGKPILGKTNDGKWRMIVNNGYNSASGRAVLKLIDINNTADVITIDTGEVLSKDSSGNPTPQNVNGLSSPVMVDGTLQSDGTMSTADGTIDYVYAGDLKGNLWRFDLSDIAPASWSVSKLFQAKGKCTSSSSTDDCIQPITVRPAVSAFQLNGKTIKLVSFGTGKVIEDCDKTSAGCSGEAYQNSFYAIRDYDDTTKNSAITPINKKTKLQKQILKNYAVGTGHFGQEKNVYIEGDRSDLSKCSNIVLTDNMGTPNDTTDDFVETLTKIDCPSFTVAYGDNPTGNVSTTDYRGTQTEPVELGWYHDLQITANTVTDTVSAKVVGDSQTAGRGTGIVKYSTFSPIVNEPDSCEIKGLSEALVPDITNGGQSRARLIMTGQTAIKNIGVVFDKPYPSGSTLIKGAKPAGLGDSKGGGDCYNCDNKVSKKIILATPDLNTGSVADRKGIVVPVNWREISESDAD